MSQQTLATDSMSHDERPMPHARKVRSAGGPPKPTLYVVNLPEAGGDGCVDAAERDRQASLELLHRLVMG